MTLSNLEYNLRNKDFNYWNSYFQNKPNKISKIIECIRIENLYIPDFWKELIANFQSKNIEVYQTSQQEENNQNTFSSLVILNTGKEEENHLLTANNSPLYSLELKSNDKIILEKIKKNSSVLLLVEERLQKDKEFVKEILLHDGKALEYAIHFQDDEEMVKLAIMHSNIKIMNYASDRLKKNPEMIDWLIQIDVKAILYVDSISVSKRNALEILQKDGSLFRWLPDFLKRDEEVVITAMYYWPWSIIDVDKDLKENKSVIHIMKLYLNYILKTQPNFVLYLGDWAVQNREIMLQAIQAEIEFHKKNYSNQPKYILKEWLNDNHLSKEIMDKDLAMRIVAIKGNYLCLLPNIFKKDKDVILKAIDNDPDAVKYAELSEENGSDIILEFIRNNKQYFQYLPESLKMNKEFVLKVYFPEVIFNQEEDFLNALYECIIKKDLKNLYNKIKEDPQLLDYLLANSWISKTFILEIYSI